MKIYIAGPMSGMPDKNYPAFNAAAEILRGGGHFVGNPAEMCPPDTTYRQAMAVDLAWISSYAELVVLLPDFQKSKGTRIEVDLALTLGIPIMKFEDAISEFARIAEENLKNGTNGKVWTPEEIELLRAAANPPKYQAPQPVKIVTPEPAPEPVPANEVAEDLAVRDGTEL